VTVNWLMATLNTVALRGQQVSGRFEVSRPVSHYLKRDNGKLEKGSSTKQLKASTITCGSSQMANRGWFKKLLNTVSAYTVLVRNASGEFTGGYAVA